MVKVTLVGTQPNTTQPVRHTIIESEPLSEMGGRIAFAQPFTLLMFEGDPVAITSLICDGHEHIEGEPLESHQVREMRERGMPIELPTGNSFSMTVRPIGPASSEGLGPPPPGYEAPAPHVPETLQQEAAGHGLNRELWQAFAPGLVQTGKHSSGSPVLVFAGPTGRCAVIQCEPTEVEQLLPGIACVSPDPNARALTLLRFLLWGGS